MKKISLARLLEESYLISVFNKDSCISHSTLVDLGGERNHYNKFLRSKFKHVLTYNLDSKNPDRVVDLTKNFYSQLIADKPDYIISLNTVEHLAEDLCLFENCLKYAINYSVTVQIIVPFMHKIHAAPHDFRRYTFYGLEKIITDLSCKLARGKYYTTFKITPIGGSWYTLVSSLCHQKSILLGIGVTFILSIIEHFELMVKALLGKKPNISYPLGYAVQIDSCLK